MLTSSSSVDANGDSVADSVVDSWTYDSPGAIGSTAQQKRTINGVLERQQDFNYDTLGRKIETLTTQAGGSGVPKTYLSQCKEK